MPSQHAHVESSLRLADKPCSIEKAEIVSQKTNSFDFVSTIDFAEESAVETAPPQPATPSKREFTSTLIEFPKRTKAPEWRDAVRERVQAVRNRKQFEAGQDEKQTSLKQSEKVAAVAETINAQPPISAMVIDLKPNIEHPANRLVARALERVERSRQTHQANDALTEFASEFTGSEEITAKTDFGSSFDNHQNLKEVSPPVAFAPMQTVKPRKILPAIDESSFNQPLYDLPCDKPAEKKKSAEPKSNKKTDGALENSPERSLKSGKSIISVLLTTPQKIEAIVENDFDSQVVAPRVKTSESVGSSEDYAPLFGRLAGGVIDLVLCAGIAFLLIIPFAPTGAFASQNITLSGALIAVGILAAVKFVYLTLALTLTETTLGLRLLGLRVVYADDATAPSLIESAINSFIYLLTLATGGLLLTAVFFSSEKRALHDLISGTVVVRET